MARRFCIFAQRRTGSNFLVSLLNSHDEINCFGEIFRNHFDIQKKLPLIDEKYTDLHRRLNNISDFLYNIETKNLDCSSMWGFKVMQNQLGGYFPRLFEFEFDAFIVLRRDNALAQYSSEEIAKITGQGVAGRRAVVKKAKAIFDEKKFQKFTLKMRKDHKLLMSIISGLSIPILEVEYKSLQEPKISEELCHFLDLRPQKLTSFHQKRNSSNILERFENQVEVYDFLEKIGKQNFAKEDLTA